MYVVIIPAYQPDATLMSICQGICSKINDRPQPKVIVIDDGSTNPASVRVFAMLAEIPAVAVLVHDRNLGKGAALKTAFAFVLDHLPEVRTVVTADADGQHLADDILSVAELGQMREEAVLGVRQFSGNVPFRSRIGNTLTRRLFQVMFGFEVSDTQTGLRAIPRPVLPKLLGIEYNRYNFEFEALITLVRQGAVHQLPIKTVYEEGNPTSHFNPLLDSARIYIVLLRHVSVVALIALADILLFVALSSTGLSVFEALVGARSLSTIIYFITARNFVFRNTGNPLVQIPLFLLLVSGNIALLTPFITLSHTELGIPKAIAMAIGTALMFASNFLWQNHIIFQPRAEDQ